MATVSPRFSSRSTSHPGGPRPDNHARRALRRIGCIPTVRIHAGKPDQSVCKRCQQTVAGACRDAPGPCAGDCRDERCGVRVTHLRQRRRCDCIAVKTERTPKGTAATRSSTGRSSNRRGPSRTKAAPSPNETRIRSILTVDIHSTQKKLAAKTTDRQNYPFLAFIFPTPQIITLAIPLKTPMTMTANTVKNNA